MKKPNRESHIALPLADKVVLFINTALLVILFVIFAYPLLYVITSSISANAYKVDGLRLFPDQISWEGYKAVFQFDRVWSGYGNSFFYMIFGTAINLFMSICAAYPLSRKDLDGRGLILGLMMFTMYFSGGMIGWNWVEEKSIAGEPVSAKTTVNSDGMTNRDWYGTGFRHQDAATRYCLTWTPENLEYHYYTESLKYVDYLPAEYIPSVMWFTDDQSEVVNDVESALISYVNEMRAAFITGTIDIEDDAQWEAYLEELEVLGMEDWVKTYQDAYTAMMSK